MAQHSLSCFCVVVALVLAGGTDNAFARGPGGPGGAGGNKAGARPSGGKKSKNQNHTQLSTKKKKQPNAGTAKNSKFDPNQWKSHNSNDLKTNKQLGGKPGDPNRGGFSPQQFKNPEQFKNPGQISSRDLASEQKWQPGQDSQRGDGQLRRQNENSARDLQQAHPFSNDWYAAHPNAWQSRNSHADAWAVTSAAGVAAWLGWGAQPTYGTSNTIVYQQAPAEESETNYAYDNSSDTATDDTSTDGSSDDDSDWLSIGVYSILAQSGESTSRLLQLACNRQGVLRGVEYDSISGESQNLSGSIDQSTQIATWQLDSNSQITYRANLSSLTNSTGTIEVSQQGRTTEWRIARQENGS